MADRPLVQCHVLVQVTVNVPLVRVKLLQTINGNPDLYSDSYSCLCERSLNRAADDGCSLRDPSEQGCTVLIGRVTGTVCSSVPHTRSHTYLEKKKRKKIPRLAWTFYTGRSNECASFPGLFSMEFPCVWIWELCWIPMGSHGSPTVFTSKTQSVRLRLRSSRWTAAQDVGTEPTYFLA